MTNKYTHDVHLMYSCVVVLLAPWRTMKTIPELGPDTVAFALVFGETHQLR